MPRQITQSVRSSIEDANSGEFFPVFAEITHPTLADPIRVVNDVVDYLYEGDRYHGCPFDIELLGDADGPPRARITVQNVDQRIGAAIEAISTSPRLTLRVMAQSDFGPIAEVDGRRTRSPLGTPVVEYEAGWLSLANITGNIISVSAEIVSYDVGREYWPGVRATQRNAPALSR